MNKQCLPFPSFTASKDYHYKSKQNFKLFLYFLHTKFEIERAKCRKRGTTTSHRADKDGEDGQPTKLNEPWHIHRNTCLLWGGAIGLQAAQHYQAVMMLMSF